MASISRPACVSPGFFPNLMDRGMMPEMMDATRLYENWATRSGLADMASWFAMALRTKKPSQVSVDVYMLDASVNTHMSKLNVFAVVSRSGKRIHANECNDKNEKEYPRGHFECIDCGNEVFVRRGNLRTWHFAHFNATERGCVAMLMLQTPYTQEIYTIPAKI